MSSSSKYRSQEIVDGIIGFSVSYQRDNLLARGLGLNHIRELLLRLARPILRREGSLAYGGYWKKSEDNFTYDLLELVKGEQEDVNPGSADSPRSIGKLYNHSAWPNYLGITAGIEAQWINCCRILRITQEEAGLTSNEIVPDSEAGNKAARTVFNAAVALSAMRRLMMERRSITLPDLSFTETIPPVVARIILGGKTEGYSGFMPGIFEEALVTLKARRPLYLLGGFGGATEALAKAILAKRGAARPPEFTVAWHKKTTPGYSDLLKSVRKFRLPKTIPPPGKVFDRLWAEIVRARTAPAATLGTGLSEPETRELLATRDMNVAVRQVLKGLTRQNKLLAPR
jgi:SLOG cluster2